MTTSQQTTSLLNTTRDARPDECAEAVMMKPNRRVPKFLQALQKMTTKVAIPSAFAAYLKLAKLPITIHGDTSGWKGAGQGALFIGDHRNGLEYFFLLAALGQGGRKDIKILGKPYALSVRLTEALDMHHEGYILPVIPRTLVSNRLNIFNRDIGMRLLNANHLSTQDEAKAVNATAMKNAASLLANGYAIGVFPTGGVKSATTSGWYRGVGEIIKLVAEEARESVMIVPFQFGHFTQFQVVATLWLYSKGFTLKPRPLSLNVGRQITVADFLISETAGSTDPQVITERLRTRYVQDFHSHTPVAG